MSTKQYQRKYYGKHKRKLSKQRKYRRTIEYGEERATRDFVHKLLTVKREQLKREIKKRYRKYRRELLVMYWSKKFKKYSRSTFRAL